MDGGWEGQLPVCHPWAAGAVRNQAEWAVRSKHSSVASAPAPASGSCPDFPSWRTVNGKDKLQWTLPIWSDFESWRSIPTVEILRQTVTGLLKVE